MLVLFLVILGSIGLILNWPVFSEGLPRLLTLPGTSAGTALYRPDGKGILILSALIVITVFFPGTRTISRLRLVALLLIVAVVAVELFFAVEGYCHLAAFTGALYSFIFYTAAFVASLLRFGNYEPLRSNSNHAPLSESSAFSRTFSRFVGNCTTRVKMSITAMDKINDKWEKGEKREFESTEIRIGRDSGWADLAVGESWGAVSKRHGMIRAVGNTLLYEPLASHYSFAVDDIPASQARELPHQCILTLVSGHGPRLNFQYRSFENPLMHPQTIQRIREIGVDEFKKLRAVVKGMIILALLALPLLWGFIVIQENSKLEPRGQAPIITQTGEDAETITINILAALCKKTDGLLKRVNKFIGELIKEDEPTVVVPGKPSPPSRPLRITAKHENAANRIAILFRSQKVHIYFPFITVFKGGDYKIGTAFFARRGDHRVYLVTLGSRVYHSRLKQWGNTYFFSKRDSYNEFKDLLNRKEERLKGESVTHFYIRLILLANMKNVLFVSSEQWKNQEKRGLSNGIIQLAYPKIRQNLIRYIPQIDTRFVPGDPVVVLGCNKDGKFYSPGRINTSDDTHIYILQRKSGGFSGGPLIKIEPGTNGKVNSVIGVHVSGNRFLKWRGR